MMEALILLAVGLPLAAIPLISMAGERNPNLREAIILITAAITFFIVWSLVEPVMEGARPDRFPAGDDAGVGDQVHRRAAGHAVRPGRLGPVDRHHDLRHRLHARPPRGEPDPVLHLLCHRHFLGHRRRLLGQHADPVPVLRGADGLHLPAGHPPRDRRRPSSRAASTSAS